MRYVTVERECKSTGSGTIIRVVKEKRPYWWEVGYLILVLSAICVIMFFVGVYVGADEAAKQISEAAKTQTEKVADPDFYSPEVPLSYGEQKTLYNASQEFGVDYYTMLGLIERETDFRNISGDGGNATGYCEDNFRTACAIIAELTDRHGSLAGALTAYNEGNYDGTVSQYAADVLKNAEKWRNRKNLL